MKSALIVVDVQRDFVEGGALAVEGGQNVAEFLNSLVIPTLQKNNVAVYFTKDWHIDPGNHFSDEPDYVDSWPVHCEAGSDGAKFAAEFEALPEEIFLKGQYAASYSGADGVNALEGDSLVERLKDTRIEHVDVVGIAFDYCVKATALDLAKAGFDTSVIKDLTASVHTENDLDVELELSRAGVSVYDGRDYIAANERNTRKK